MTDPIKVAIESAKWVSPDNNYMNIPSQHKTYFPEDAFIPRGTGKQHKHLLDEKGITLFYEGSSAPTRCMLELRESGKFRPSDRGAIRSFYEATGAKEGDIIVFAKSGEREFRVSLVQAGSK